jgi:hypothetical protein
MSRFAPLRRLSHIPYREWRKRRRRAINDLRDTLNPPETGPGRSFGPLPGTPGVDGRTRQFPKPRFGRPTLIFGSNGKVGGITENLNRIDQSEAVHA